MAKIMIVEDDMTTNNLVGDYLIDAGHTIFSAYDGLEALRHFQQESIELIVLDIMLPNMDGIQVLKEIRKEIILRSRFPWSYWGSVSWPCCVVAGKLRKRIFGDAEIFL